MPERESVGATDRQGSRIPLGKVLLDRDAVRRTDLSHALRRQRSTGARLGEVLAANGWSSPENVAAALAEQRGLPYCPLPVAPISELSGRLSLKEVQEHRAVPWTVAGGKLVLATPDPDRAAAFAAAAGAEMAVVTEADFQHRICEIYGAQLADEALVRTPRHQSVRSLDGARFGLVTVLLVLTIAAIASAENVLLALTLIVFLVSGLTTATRLAALAVSRSERVVSTRPEVVALADHRPQPMVSLLIPLYREGAVLARLLEGLQRLDYPRDRLEVKLLIEADDPETADALASVELPRWIEALTIPRGSPRTKPRALNVALDFCRGDVIGILDAEDRPDPAQIKTVTSHFTAASHRVAAVQCQLAYFNARENWITRCFQIEYSIWFDVLLRGWQRLGLPIPLGGTSVYFRRQALVNLGGWDAHNVTEDADLGMRIARAGLICDVVGSTTTEEANCRIGPWIRQRSRWLKGYMMTWLCHMRRPGLLWRELGPAGFIGLQVLLLGGAVSYLVIPLFWISLTAGMLTGASLFGQVLPVWALGVLAATFALGQAVMLAAAALALYRRRCLRLILWLPLLPIYWSFGALAAWKALFEVVVAPYFWEKTNHGVTRFCPDGGDAAAHSGIKPAAVPAGPAVSASNTD